MTTRLKQTDETVWQRQTQITKMNLNDSQKSTALERSVRQLLEGLNMFHGTNLTLNCDVDQGFPNLSMNQQIKQLKKS